MKVLIVASWWPTRDEPAGGAFIEDQARILARRHDVYVIAPDPQRWNRLPRWRLTSPPVVRTPAGYWLARPVVHPILPRHPRTFIPLFARAASNAFDFAKTNWGQPDVIHAHTSIPGGFAAVGIGSDSGIPVVLTEHSFPRTLRWDRPTERAFGRVAMRGAAVRIAVSDSLAEAYRATDQLAFEIVPNVVDTELFAPAARRREPGNSVRFTLVGRLEPLIKGVDVALRAIAQLPTGTPLTLTIAGDGRDRANLVRLAAKLRIDSRVRFLGYLDRRGVRDLLDETDVLLVPSRWESFGVVAVEALAMGVPVIASNTGGLSDIVGDEFGWLVEPGDEESLRIAMASALTGERRFNPDALRASAVRRFGVDGFLDRMDAVYASVVRS
jgi:glycosyltransferase involved in cell wall biosynthesis